MGLKEKDKIKIDDLTLYEPIFTSNMQKSKVNVPFVKNLPIFIVLIAMITYGCVSITAINIKQNAIIEGTNSLFLCCQNSR
jgi:hypothetical protein